jgi:hypothetical protein
MLQTDIAFLELNTAYKRATGNDFSCDAWIVADFSTDDSYRVAVITHNEEYSDELSRFKLGFYSHHYDEIEPRTIFITDVAANNIATLRNLSRSLLNTKQKALRLYQSELMDYLNEESFPKNGSLKLRNYDADESEREPLFEKISDVVRVEFGESFLKAWLYVCDHLRCNCDEKILHLKAMVREL